MCALISGLCWGDYPMLTQPCAKQVRLLTWLFNVHSAYEGRNVAYLIVRVSNHGT